MDGSLAQLLAANIAFVGTHFAMSHPLRASMVKTLGEGGFQIAYSIVSLVTLGWVYWAFKAAPPSDLGGSGDLGWIIATALTLPAMILFAGSLVGNPALPVPGAQAAARADPKGVFEVTRHPMMWGFGLWALSHVVLWWSTRTLITASAIGLLALIGAHLQDRKKEVLMGDAWKSWESKTSYWPKLSAFAQVRLVPFGLGLALFAALSWLHLPLGGIPAGIWRWL
ncbi:MAG: NnrU family protein [Pseudomonadota bacterium]